MRAVPILVLGPLIAGVLSSSCGTREDASSPEEALAEVRALVAELEEAWRGLFPAPAGAPERDVAPDAMGRFRELRSRSGARLAELAEAHPGTDAALEAWLTDAGLPGQDPAHLRTALDALTRDFAARDELATLATGLRGVPYPGVADALRAWCAAAAGDEAEANLAYSLARHLVQFAGFARDRALVPPDELEASGGDGAAGALDAALAAVDPEALEAEAASLFEEVVTRWPDVRERPAPQMALLDVAVGPEAELGELAAIDLRELHTRWPGDVAPDLEGVDTEGGTLRLGELRGRVVVLGIGPGARAFADGLPWSFAGEPVAFVAVESPETTELLGGSEDWRIVRDEHGRIAREWNAGARIQAVWILDARGVIRFRPTHPDFVPLAVERLLEEGLDLDAGAAEPGER